MSVTYKFGSKDTVSKQFAIPVIDLCSDDDTKLFEEAVKASSKGKCLHTGEHGSVAKPSRKKMKLSESNTLNKIEFVDQNVITDMKPHSVIKGKRKNIDPLTKAAKYVLVVDISNGSSG